MMTGTKKSKKEMCVAAVILVTVNEMLINR